MDFLHRNGPSQQPNARPATSGGQSSTGGVTTGGGSAGRSSRSLQPRWLQVASVVLLFSVTALIVAVVVLFNRGSATKEADFVDNSRYQAVFLNNDQVYFGRIGELNTRYINLVDVYYLSAQQSDENQDETNLALVKLGCEVHGPSDQLIINRDQVAFWENVKTDSRLAKGIKEWQDQNPNGQTCTDSNAQTSETNQQSPQQAVGAGGQN